MQKINPIKLSIVIPCYNEEKNIPLLIEKFNEKDVLSRKDIEIILVDNGSVDNSNKIITNLSKKYKSLKLVTVKKNIGYGFGIISGLKSANGEYIGWTHADLQANPHDVIKAFEIIRKKSNPKHFFIKGRRWGRTFIDQFFTFGMSIIESVILRTTMFDINAQPNLFHRDFLKLMKNPPNDFSFDLYAYHTAKKNKMRIIRFPVFFGKRIHGYSSWNSGLKSKIKLIKRTISYTSSLKMLLKRSN